MTTTAPSRPARPLALTLLTPLPPPPAPAADRFVFDAARQISVTGDGTPATDAGTTRSKQCVRNEGCNLNEIDAIDLW